MNQVEQMKKTSHTLHPNKNTYWEEQREYFKQKTIAFKELKKKRQIELMKNELEKGTKI
jgi:hypothetical protein